MVLTELSNISSRGGVEHFYGKAEHTGAGYTAFWIPEKAHVTVYGAGRIHTAGEYKIEITGDSRAECEADTHVAFDVFGENKTLNQDFQFDLPGPSCVICTWVSGSVSFVVRAI